MKRKMRAVEKMPPITEFREGDLARNKKFGWVGIVRVVECGICATPYKDGNPTCPHREFPSPLLSIEQSGFLKPWCLPDRFELTAIGPSVWWLLRHGPLTVSALAHKMSPVMHES